MEWKLADAKNRLSELVTKAITEGPQIIRRHNDVVAVLAEPTYRALTGERPTLTQLLLDGPSLEAIVPDRDRASMRSVEL